MKDKWVVLIVGKKGGIRDGIEALVEAIPEVKKVICFEDREIDRLSEQIARLTPELVIVDFSHLQSRQRARSRLSQLRSLVPLTKVLMLIEDDQSSVESMGTEADVELVKGFRGDQLIETVRGLIKGGNVGKSGNF